MRRAPASCAPLPVRLLPACVLIVALAPRPTPPAPEPPRRSLCIEQRDRELVAVDCREHGMRFASERARAAAGLPVCWWSASAHRMTSIAGVGPATARRLVEARDRGLTPSPMALDALPGIGPATARRIVGAVETDCQRRTR